MPYDLGNPPKCATCEFGYCVTYIREQSKRMKDRDTVYRASQNKLMACAFDESIPTLPSFPAPTATFDEILTRVKANALAAGNYVQLHNPQHFGIVEKPFFLTPAQLGKVTGDVFETLFRAIAWNVCSGVSARAGKRKVAFVTLGDDYDISRLFRREDSEKLSKLLDKLAEAGSGFAYSTPDAIAVALDGLEDPILAEFARPMLNLGEHSLGRLNSARSKLEGKLKPDRVILGCGIKTSIRSDRMYQFLYEANAWKAIWRVGFEMKPPAYVTFSTDKFGADSEKLNSAEFLTLDGTLPVSRAVDTFSTITSPQELSAALLKLLDRDVQA